MYKIISMDMNLQEGGLKSSTSGIVGLASLSSQILKKGATERE